MGSLLDDPSTMDRLKNESQAFGDIIQEDFLDTYKNLTYKAIMWMKWVNAYCAHAFYLLKIDDDVFVNRYTLMKLIRNYFDNRLAATSSITCRVYTTSEVIRDKNSKWYVNEDEYQGTTYMPYCFGPAYALSMDLVRLFYNISFSTKFLWIDDVYVTGVLVKRLENIGRKVTFLDVGSKMVLSGQDLSEMKPIADKALFIHLSGEHKLQYDYWRDLLEARGLISTTSTSTTTTTTTMELATSTAKETNKIVLLDDYLKQNRNKKMRKRMKMIF